MIGRKPALHSNENEFINWYFNHKIAAELKVLTCFIVFIIEEKPNISVAFKLITKEIQYSEVATKKLKRKRSTTKNEVYSRLMKIFLCMH